MAQQNEAAEKAEKPDYYYTVIEEGIVKEQVAAKFDRRCNEYEAMHEVKWRGSSFCYYNTKYVFTMTFCCDGDDGGGPYAAL